MHSPEVLSELSGELGQLDNLLIIRQVIYLTAMSNFEPC